MHSPHWNQVNFDVHTKIKRFAARVQTPSQFRPPTQRPGHSITTLKIWQIRSAGVRFDTSYKKNVNADPNTKTKSNSILQHKNQVNFDATNESSQFNSKSKSVSMPRHKHKAKFDPDTTTKYFSTPTQKPSQYRSPQCNQVNFDHPHNNEIIFLHTLKSSQVRSPDWNQVNFDYLHQNQVNFDVRTQTKWFSARTKKTSQFRSLHWN